MAAPEPIPRLILPDPPAIWSLGMPPEIMTEFLVAFLRAHFADANNIVDPTFRSLVWSADPSTPIAILAQDDWDPNLIELRPGLVVKDHAWRPQRIGINDEHLGGLDPTGNAQFSCIYNSSNTIFCIAGTPKEAKRLGTEVTRELVQYASPIREHLGLIRFVVSERSECSILEESRQNYAVPVVVAYQAGETWKLEPQVPRLRKIILAVTANQYR